MRALTLLLLLGGGAMGATLETSVSINATAFCPAVAQTGGASAAVTQSCTHPSGFAFNTGTASAEAAPGDVHASTIFGSNISAASGSRAFAAFSTPLVVTSDVPGAVTLLFAIQFAGRVQNHPDSHATAQATFHFNGVSLGTFAPPFGVNTPFNTTVTWSAPAPVSTGEVFTLQGAVEAKASDYFGYADLRAQVLQVSRVDASGALVPVLVDNVPAAVPEPATGAMLLGGIALVYAVGRRRLAKVG